MKRFFNILLGAMAMLAVALISAFISMRLAIHGREVEVPNFAGLTLTEASHAAGAKGLSLHLENRFYSANVAPGHILAQSPAPGVTVRREWTVRVTESLGTQKVSIPDLIGQTERPASILVRRLSLDLGTVAQMPASSESGIILAQTPTPDASGIDRPRVSLLLSGAEEPPAFVMPSLTGLTLASAAARAAAVGLHISSLEDVTPPAPAALGAPATVAPVTGTPGTLSPGTVVDQSPAAGYRVVKGDAVSIKLMH